MQEIAKATKTLNDQISSGYSVLGEVDHPDDLKINLGKPDEDFKNEVGNTIFVYQSKKYGIPCERRFEINLENIVIGFVSNGC